MASRVAGVRARSQRVTVVDVGRSAVSAIEADTRGGSPRILRCGSAPLASGAWDDPAALRDRIAEATRAALAAGGIHARAVVAVIPRRMVTVKAARFPQAEPDQMAGMVRFEAQQYIPFPLDEVVLSHRVLGDAEDGMVSVLVTAARRPLVDAVVAGLEKAGVEPRRLAVSSLCLSALVPASNEGVALVVADGDNVEIAIVRDGQPVFSRAGEPVRGGDRAVAVADEIARSVAAFRNEYRGVAVARVLLVVSRTAGFGVAEVQAALDLPVEALGGPLDAQDPEAATYAVALGAALETGESGASVSLLPPSRAERVAAARQRVVALAVAGLALIAVIAVAMYSNAAAERARRERAIAARENRRLEALEKVLARVRADHDQAAKTYRTVMAGTSRRIQAVDVMKAVSDGIPRDGAAFITQLTYERAGSVSLRGIASSQSAATDLVLAYQKMDAFREARLGYVGDAQSEQAPLLPELEGGNGSAPLPSTSFLITCRLPAMEGATELDGASPRATVREAAAGPAGSGGSREQRVRSTPGGREAGR